MRIKGICATLRRYLVQRYLSFNLASMQDYSSLARWWQLPGSYQQVEATREVIVRKKNAQTVSWQLTSHVIWSKTALMTEGWLLHTDWLIDWLRGQIVFMMGQMGMHLAILWLTFDIPNLSKKLNDDKGIHSEQSWLTERYVLVIWKKTKN